MNPALHQHVFAFSHFSPRGTAFCLGLQFCWLPLPAAQSLTNSRLQGGWGRCSVSCSGVSPPVPPISASRSSWPSLRRAWPRASLSACHCRLRCLRTVRMGSNWECFVPRYFLEPPLPTQTRQFDVWAILQNPHTSGGCSCKKTTTLGHEMAKEKGLWDMPSNCHWNFPFSSSKKNSTNERDDSTKASLQVCKFGSISQEKRSPRTCLLPKIVEHGA